MSPSNAMNGRWRINNFDQVRLFGAILVIYGHSYPLTGVTLPGFAANPVSTIGVKIFFSISGYLIAASWLRDPNILRFFCDGVCEYFLLCFPPSYWVRCFRSYRSPTTFLVRSHISI
jgi:peptidoglycan/LPS O-acetylase OafA/YrhL